MPDDQNERAGEKLKARVAELERVVLALVKGMKDAESELGEPLMPVGDYFGISFKD